MSAVKRTSPAVTVTKISELYEKSRDVTVEGVVLVLGEPRQVNARNGATQILDCILEDDEGNTVNISAWGDKADKMKSQVVTQTRLRFYALSARPANQRYSTTTSSVALSWGPNTACSVIGGEAKRKPLSLQEIASRPTGSLIHVTGLVITVGQIVTSNKEGRITMRRDFKLSLPDSSIIRCVKFANSEEELDIVTGQRLKISGATTTVFNSEMSLTLGRGTVIEVEEEGADISGLDIGASTTPTVQILDLEDVHYTQSSNTIGNILYGVCNNESTTMNFTIIASITSIEPMGDNMVVDVCATEVRDTGMSRNCNKLMREFGCPDHGECERACQVRLNIKLTDGKHSITAAAFGLNDFLFGCTAESLKSLDENERRYLCNSAIERHDVKVRIRRDFRTFKNETVASYVIQDMEAINIAQQAAFDHAMLLTELEEVAGYKEFLEMDDNEIAQMVACYQSQQKA